MIIALYLAVLFLAFANGANDNFKGVASLFGCGATSYQSALRWATLTTLAGSICALFLAQTLMARFSGKGLAPDNLTQSLPFIVAVATGAGLTVILATRIGFPVSTTHALLGALIGATAIEAPSGLNLTALKAHFVMPLLLSPLMALLLAITVYGALKRWMPEKIADTSVCLCAETEIVTEPAIGPEIAGTEMTRVMINDEMLCQERGATIIFNFSKNRLADSLHFISAGAVCFARGLNDTPKIAALLLLVPGLMNINVVLVAAAMAVGGLLNARRIAETLSHKITTINHCQGLSANLTTALLVISASKLGLPVSTTHVSTGALFGIGLANRQGNIRMMLSILLSWLLTLPCGALPAGAAYYCLVSN